MQLSIFRREQVSSQQLATVNRPDPVICLLTASGRIDITARYKAL
jgi:hypothetical protein